MSKITPDSRQEGQRWHSRSPGGHHGKQFAEEDSFHLGKNKHHFCQLDMKMNLRSRWSQMQNWIVVKRVEPGYRPGRGKGLEEKVVESHTGEETGMNTHSQEVGDEKAERHEGGVKRNAVEKGFSAAPGSEKVYLIKTWLLKSLLVLS